MQVVMQCAIRQEIGDYNHIEFYIIIKMQNIVLSMGNGSYKSYSTTIKDKQKKAWTLHAVPQWSYYGISLCLLKNPWPKFRDCWCTSLCIIIPGARTHNEPLRTDGGGQSGKTKQSTAGSRSVEGIKPTNTPQAMERSRWAKEGCVPERICGPWRSGSKNSKQGGSELASSDPQRGRSRGMRHRRTKYENSGERSASNGCC